MPPVISVLMPCRNAASTLPEAIESITRQTFADWELIVVDDGSIDDSPAIAAAASARDGRVRCLGLPAPLGIVAALQSACAAARAPLLARMDADDVALPGRLESQVAFLDANPRVALCGCRVVMIGERVGSGRREYEQWINSLTDWEPIRCNLLVECPIAHPAFLMRRDPFDRVGGYREGPWPEDYDLVLRLVRAGHQLGNVPEVLLHWRESEGRLSRTDPRYSPEAFRALKRHHLSRTVLPPGRTFVQWGAGDVGKRWLREWGAEHRPKAVVDVDPAKIGQRIHEVPVIAPDEVGSPQGRFLVAAVGAPGARDLIRAFLSRRGWRETVDFLFLA